jgi:hypothetical protein
MTRRRGVGKAGIERGHRTQTRLDRLYAARLCGSVICEKRGATLRSVNLLPPGTGFLLRLPEINGDRATASDGYTMRAR